MSSRSKTCEQCGRQFYSRLGYILCEHCINMALYGYDPDEDDEHTSGYSARSFREINAKLLEECRQADSCGKSYGNYKADIRRWLKDGFRK